MKTRNQKLEEYIQKAQEYLPGVSVRESISWFNSENQDEPTSGKIELSGRFLNDIALKNGKVQFIHYTSLASTMNILNAGKVRLYNCLNLNDPSEVKYLLNKSPIDFSEEEVEKYKREHFILSGCIHETSSDEDFNLWRLYGDEGRGIGIVFEIDNKVKNWSNVFAHKVNYQSERDRKVYDFLEFHQEFNKEHNLFENKPDFFALLSTGVKNKIWSIENEFRIVAKTPFNEHNLKAKTGLGCNDLLAKELHHEYKSDGRLVSYIQIPLHLNSYTSQSVKLPISEKKVDTLDYAPNLKLKKLILEPNINPVKDEFYQYIHMIKNKLKYDFKVEKSSIKL